MSPLLEQTLEWVRSQTRAIDDRDLISDEKRADAALVRRVLGSEDGEALLLLIAKMSVLRPALDPRLHGSASHDFAQRRTGENQLFAALIHYRDLADHLERTPDDRPRERPDFGWGSPDGGDAADPRFGDAEDRWDPSGTIAGG